MDIGEVEQALLAASDASRFGVAQEIARGVSPPDLLAIAKLLVSDQQALRLGAISVLRAASFKAAAGPLVAIAKMRMGGERALALQTLADLCSAADRDKLLPALEASRDDPDEDVQEARHRLMSLCAPREQLAEKAGTTSMVFGLLAADKDQRRAALLGTLKDHPDPARMLADSLKETRNDTVRMDLLGGIGTLPPERIADAVDICTDGGDGDLLALLARMTERKLQGADSDVRLRVARKLLAAHDGSESVIAREALRSAARALSPALAVANQARDVASLEPDELPALLDTLTELDDEQRRVALLALVAGLGKAPARVGIFAESLYADTDKLDVVARTRLATLCVQAAAATDQHGPDNSEELARHLGPLARLYARVMLPGATLPSQLVVGLRLSPDDRDRLALVELLGAVRTEESADALKELHDGKQNEEVKARAQQALRAFDSPEVEVLFHPDQTFELLPRYTTPSGERLVSDGRSLLDRAGQHWLLAADGAPMREADAPHGGCRCCFRPRALEPARAPGEDADAKEPLGDAPPARPTCPVTGKRHLVGDEGPVLCDGHPLGGCLVCDSLRPLERSGSAGAQRVLCPSCHQVYERDGDRFVPRKQKPQATITFDYAGDGQQPPARSDVLPEIDDVNIIPPTEQDLDDLPDSVVRAMRANVVLYGKGSFKGWGGTGILIAQSGDEFAILTARQNVEETDGETPGRRVPLTCVSITGEFAQTRVLWTAEGGIDLAVLGVTLQNTDALACVPLSDSRPPKLGADLFAVGNQLGFPWSYTSGSVSGVRTLTTSGGLELRYIQTPMPLATGSGGGGLYDSGELAGLVSWYRISGWSDSTNFAISADSIVATLRREKVRFAGAPLVDADTA